MYLGDVARKLCLTTVQVKRTLRLLEQHGLIFKAYYPYGRFKKRLHVRVNRDKVREKWVNYKAEAPTLLIYRPTGT